LLAEPWQILRGQIGRGQGPNQPGISHASAPAPFL
jgi:hypothetical protein